MFFVFIKKIWLFTFVNQPPTIITREFYYTKCILIRKWAFVMVVFSHFECSLVGWWCVYVEMVVLTIIAIIIWRNIQIEENGCWNWLNPKNTFWLNTTRFHSFELSGFCHFKINRIMKWTIDTINNLNTKIIQFLQTRNGI